MHEKNKDFLKIFYYKKCYFFTKNYKTLYLKESGTKV